LFLLLESFDGISLILGERPLLRTSNKKYPREVLLLDENNTLSYLYQYENSFLRMFNGILKELKSNSLPRRKSNKI
jgi:hypothetical protein